MPDAYDRIFQELSRRLPNKDDIELLQTLLESLRKGGREEAETEIKDMIKKLAGEV